MSFLFVLILLLSAYISIGFCMQDSCPFTAAAKQRIEKHGKEAYPKTSKLDVLLPLTYEYVFNEPKVEPEKRSKAGEIVDKMWDLIKSGNASDALGELREGLVKLRDTFAPKILRQVTTDMVTGDYLAEMERLPLSSVNKLLDNIGLYLDMAIVKSLVIRLVTGDPILLVKISIAGGASVCKMLSGPMTTAGKVAYKTALDQGQKAYGYLAEIGKGYFSAETVKKADQVLTAASKAGGVVLSGVNTMAGLAGSAGVGAYNRFTNWRNGGIKAEPENSQTTNTVVKEEQTSRTGDPKDDSSVLIEVMPAKMQEYLAADKLVLIIGILDEVIKTAYASDQAALIPILKTENGESAQTQNNSTEATPEKSATPQTEEEKAKEAEVIAYIVGLMNGVKSVSTPEARSKLFANLLKFFPIEKLWPVIVELLAPDIANRIVSNVSDESINTVFEESAKRKSLQEIGILLPTIYYKYWTSFVTSAVSVGVNGVVSVLPPPGQQQLAIEYPQTNNDTKALATNQTDK